MLISVSQAAEKLGISEVTVRRLIKLRRIPYRKIGDRYLFTESDIDSYLEVVKVPAVPRQRVAADA